MQAVQGDASVPSEAAAVTETPAEAVHSDAQAEPAQQEEQQTVAAQEEQAVTDPVGR